MKKKVSIEKKLEKLFKKFLGEYAKEIKVKKVIGILCNCTIFKISLRDINLLADIDNNYKKFIEELERYRMDNGIKLKINAYAVYTKARPVIPDDLAIVDYGYDDCFEGSLEEIVIEIEISGKETLEEFERLIDKFLILSI